MHIQILIHHMQSIMSTALSFPLSLADQIDPYLPASKDVNNKNVENRNLPWVTLTFATSLDSALSLKPGVQTILSGPVSKAMTHHLRSFHNAILVGVSTAVADDPGLNCRIDTIINADAKRHPIPIILDPHARWEINANSRVIKTAKEGKGRAPFIIVSSSVDSNVIQSRWELLRQHGGGYLHLNTDETEKFKWGDVLSILQDRLKIESVMIEGGGSIINSLLEDERSRYLVDSVIVTIAPTWLGKGGVVVSPERKGDDYVPPRLRDVKWIPMGQDVVLCGRL
ncbi:2,5-diamino-6-(ribosylamino)-4(3H)-pyrimidinone 5'-phosphate reductase [Orbilia ellipsospora]|uniref:2,5-diamino-6-ribosylamino-4(3H)-pyrimidinone 5'-phosphate reductase n=1 Tax=Orbilia ellipsospora TaxID=2528407 RepID=A0AAV9WYF6_9PEZI